MYHPKGIIPAMATPFRQDGSLNLEELGNQVERFIKSGVHAIFTLGTNGEFYALSFDEKVQVMETVIEKTAGRIPVWVGTGCVTTEETIRLSKRAEQAGATALSVITPYFGQVSQKAMVGHYKAVAKAVSLPILMYNIPARTGNSISRETVAELAQVENIIGIKDSSGNFDNTLQYLEATDRKFAVIAGNDSLILSTLMAGGVGAIAGTGNIVPERLVEMYNAWESGDIAKATALQDSIRPIRDCLKLGNPNSVIKRAANLIGYPVGPARAPFDGDYTAWDPVLMKTLREHYPELLK